jgi:hypothetical protein
MCDAVANRVEVILGEEARTHFSRDNVGVFLFSFWCDANAAQNIDWH